MKTYSIEWPPINLPSSHVILTPVRRLPAVLRLATKAFLALVPALAIIVAATWLVTLPEQVIYLQATIWAAGFVFLGLALESESAEVSILNLATGIALPGLALLSSHIAIEFVIVAATLVAAWAAAGIMRK